MTAYGFIYALHAEGYKFRYVGQTNKTVEHRLAGHLAAARSTKSKLKSSEWIRKCNRAGIKIVAVELERVPLSEICEAEARWIAKLREEGYKLLNTHKAPRQRSRYGTGARTPFVEQIPVALTEGQLEFVRAEADDRNVSMAAVIRDGLNLLMKEKLQK